MYIFLLLVHLLILYIHKRNVKGVSYNIVTTQCLQLVQLVVCVGNAIVRLEERDLKCAHASSQDQHL